MLLQMVMAPQESVRMTLNPAFPAASMTLKDGWPYGLGPTDMTATPAGDAPSEDGSESLW